MKTSKEVSALLRMLGKQLEHWGPRKGEEIQQLEANFGIVFPSDYRQFIGNYGAISVGDIQIFGLGSDLLSMREMKIDLHLLMPDLPLNFIPVEMVDETRFAGFFSTEAKGKHSPIVSIDLDTSNDPQVLADSFYDYLYDRLATITGPLPEVPDEAELVEKAVEDDTTAFLEEALATFEKHVIEFQETFEYDHHKGGRLPRNHDWRPYRYCIQDVLFGLTVVRHQRIGNYLEVDVFLTAHIPEYGELAGALALAAFLLSEAYKCGGTMEIRFTAHVENGRVPAELQALAAGYSIQFADAANGRISATEAKQLYAGLTHFTPELLNRLIQGKRIAIERACFSVHHGIWTCEQIEMFALASPQPESILRGEAQPHQRHLYFRDLLHARGALLAGTLDRRLSKRDRVDEHGRSFDLEDDIRPLESQFVPHHYAHRYSCPESMIMPWGYGQVPNEIPAKQPFYILIRARDLSDIRLHYLTDINLGAKLLDETQCPVFILYPQDFTALSRDIRDQITDHARNSCIGLLLCPEFVNSLDNEAAQKLARSRLIRQ